jgi:HEPN domain-containing protein
MDRAEAYIQTAMRALQAARTLRQTGLHEAATFHACHAFEQAGSALSLTLGKEYPGGHAARANDFKDVAHDMGIGHNIEELADKVPDLRETALYPRVEPPHTPPFDRVTPQEADELVTQVHGEVMAVRRYI